MVQLGAPRSIFEVFCSMGGPGGFWGHLGGLGGILGVQVGCKSPRNTILGKFGSSLEANLGSHNLILCCKIFPEASGSDPGPL